MNLTGNISDYFVVFGAGVLVSFTPCVYPLLPITAGFIAGANTSGTRWRGLFLSLVYVLGIAVTYSGLAVISSLTGQAFGRLQNMPVYNFIVSAALLFFGFVMLDKVLIPSLGVDLRTKFKPRNFRTVFFFGLASGLVVGPCLTPVLGTLLFYIASQQNILHSVSLMFVFSYGVGTSLILVGTFSGLLGHLPKSGIWMTRIKNICAVILFAAAFYFLLKGMRWLL